MLTESTQSTAWEVTAQITPIKTNTPKAGKQPKGGKKTKRNKKILTVPETVAAVRASLATTNAFVNQMQALEILCEQVDATLNLLPLQCPAQDVARIYARDRAMAWVIVSMVRTDNATLAHADIRAWNGAQLELARQLLDRTTAYEAQFGKKQKKKAKALNLLDRKSLDRQSIDSGLGTTLMDDYYYQQRRPSALDKNLKLEVTDRTIPALLDAATEVAERLAGLLNILCDWVEYLDGNCHQ